MREGPAYRNVTGSSGRRPWAGVVAVVALVGVAVLKPWAGPVADLAAEASPSGTSARGAIAAPIAAPPPRTAAELATTSCPGSLLWMVHSFQRRDDEIFNVWTVTEPVPAASADPATIAYTPIYASQIMAFGYCAPGEGALRPQAKDAVTIWRVGEGPSLVPMPVISVDAGLRPDFGALLGPGPAIPSGPGASGWPAGRYLIRVGAAVLGAEVVLS